MKTRTSTGVLSRHRSFLAKLWNRVNSIIIDKKIMGQSIKEKGKFLEFSWSDWLCLLLANIYATGYTSGAFLKRQNKDDVERFSYTLLNSLIK